MKSFRNPLLWCILLAIAVRLALYKPNATTDSERFSAQAKSLLSGEGFRRLDRQNSRLRTDVPPGYPVFLAAVYTVTTSWDHVRALHFVMSVATCVVVYAAIRPASPKAALAAMLCLAISWPHARYVGYILSESFGTFLAALLVGSLARLETSGAGPLRCCAIGLLSVALLLTVPATAVLAFFIWCYAAWHVRRQPLALLALVGSSLLLMIPWQVHCYHATGRIQPTVFTSTRRSKAGFPLWRRTWDTGHGGIATSWRHDRFLELPDTLFASAAQRRELTALHEKATSYKLHWTAPEVDRAFRRAANDRIEAAPWSFYLLLPLSRATFLWFPFDQAWQTSVWQLERLPFAGAPEERGAPYRAATLVAGTLGCIVLFLPPLMLVAIAVGTLRRREPMPWLILLATAVYTFISAYFGIGEARRDLPFYPAVLFILFYLCRTPFPASESADMVDSWL